MLSPRLGMVVCILFSGALLAQTARLTGRWEGEVKGKTQVFVFDYKFAVKGSAFTGTVHCQTQPATENCPDEDLPIVDGKISGNAISFSVKRDKNLIPFTGTIDGDQLALDWKNHNGSTPHMTVVRKGR